MEEKATTILAVSQIYNEQNNIDFILSKINLKDLKTSKLFKNNCSNIFFSFNEKVYVYRYCVLQRKIGKILNNNIIPL